MRGESLQISTVIRKWKIMTNNLKISAQVSPASAPSTVAGGGLTSELFCR